MATGFPSSQKHIPKSDHLMIMILVVILFSISPVHSSAPSVTHNKPFIINKLVHKICNHTSSYSFCVKALYTDSRTPKADDYTLAFIAVGMAYTNASATRSHINQLLKKASTPPSLINGLRRCSRDYAKAVSAFEIAYNDLNSETFFELVDLAGDADRAANDCQAAFLGTTPHSPPPPLATHNRDLKLFSQICAAVGKMFTGELS